MKKPLLIWVSVLTLLGVSATLFAQTTTGSSVITQMKAGVRAFNANLLTELNGNDATPSDYDSSPLIGKETGDMLTAGEWNRVLELVAQGGGGGGRFEINDSTTKTTYRLTYYPADLWSTSSPTPTTIACTDGQTECKIIDTAAHDLCLVTSIAGTAPHVSLTYQGNKRYRLYNSYRDSASLAPYSSWITVQCYDNIGGGGSGGGGGLTLLSSYPQLDCFELGTTDYTCTGQKATLSATPTPYTLDLATVSGVTVPAWAQLAYICATVRTISSQDAGGAVSIGSGPGNVGASSPSHGGTTDRDHGGDSNCWFTPLVQTTKISYTFNKGPTNPLGAWWQITLAGFQ